jgi:hypothetical protein
MPSDLPGVNWSAEEKRQYVLDLIRYSGDGGANGDLTEEEAQWLLADEADKKPPQ